MKLLTETADIAEMERLRMLFESNGILVHIGNNDTARNLSFIPAFNKYAIHVVYDEQYTDALKLLEDEDHVVENPLDIEALRQQMDGKHVDAMTIILKKIVLAIVVLVLIVASLIIYVENR